MFGLVRPVTLWGGPLMRTTARFILGAELRYFAAAMCEGISGDLLFWLSEMNVTRGAKAMAPGSTATRPPSTGIVAALMYDA